MYKNIEKQTKLNLKDQCILRSATVGITLLNDRILFLSGRYKPANLMPRKALYMSST